MTPWSAELFSNEKIERRVGDAFELVKAMTRAQYDAIIHDPPTVKLAGELYSLEATGNSFACLSRGTGYSTAAATLQAWWEAP